MYNVGDKLRVKSWEDMVLQYRDGDMTTNHIVSPGWPMSGGWFYKDTMGYLCGEDFTVKSITPSGRYLSEEGVEGLWFIAEYMLEPRTEQELEPCSEDELISLLQGAECAI